MIGPVRLLLALAALLTATLALPANGQGAPDIAGAWHGAVASPQGEITLVLHVTRGEDGALGARIENFSQNPGNPADVTEITAADGRLVWRVAQINASYEGTWDEAAQQWKGTFNQGRALPLNLSMGAPPPRPVIAGLDGVWVGIIERNGARLRQVLSVRTVEQGTFALYSSPDQLVNGVPVADLAREGQAVSLSVFGGLSKFAGALSDDGTQLTGTWTSPSQPEVTMTFTKATEEALAARRNPNRPQNPTEPFPYKAEEVAFDNPAAPGVRLAGTLTLPEGEEPFPAAIMLTGSGPQDRDEALMGHKPFAVIADHLTRSGIAVLRFDDRGTAKSTGNYAAATSPDHASDANAAFAWLATRPEIRRDAIGFVGHSEGGITAPTAMASNDDVAYFVSMAGPGTSLVELLLSQRRLLTTQMGLSQAEIDRQEPVMRAIFQAIAAADTPQAGYDAALAVLTPEAKTALGMPVEMDGALVVRQVSEPWLQYLLKYDPVPNLARIEVPVLAMNGSLDLQVPPKENLAVFREALKDNPDVTIVELPGLNHLFQTARTGALGEYRDIEETFSPAALELISDWIRERFVEE
jgi:dienelactone hydrolase